VPIQTPSQYRRQLVLLGLACLLGCLGGLAVARRIPAGLRDDAAGLRAQPFALQRGALDALAVTPERWLTLPFLVGDFDLHLELTLDSGAELDLLLRQVEPRFVGKQMEPFHGRFEVLRLSAVTAGSPWLRREEALLGDARGGLLLSPGVPATVAIQARGRELTANVAGRRLSPQVAADCYGMGSLVARGGQVRVQRLVLTPLGLANAMWWRSGTWAALGATLGGSLFLLGRWLARRVRRPSPWYLLPAGLLAGAVGVLLLPHGGLPLAFPPPGELAAGLLVLFGGGVLGWPGAVSWRAIAAVVAVVAGALGARAAPVPATPQLDAVFGPHAGAGLSEALAQRVRGPFAVHSLADARRGVFLLGGQLLYDRGAPDEHLELLLAGELRVRRQQRVAVPAAPTVDGHASQQWELYTRFYRGFAPSVLVFGVGRDEAAIEGGRPRSSPEQLAATLAAVRQECASQGIGLLLLVERELPPALRASVQAVADAGVPLVWAEASAAPAELAQRLAVGVLQVWPGP
jgi:hypothetical protein